MERLHGSVTLRARRRTHLLHIVPGEILDLELVVWGGQSRACKSDDKQYETMRGCCKLGSVKRAKVQSRSSSCSTAHRRTRPEFRRPCRVVVPRAPPTVELICLPHIMSAPSISLALSQRRYSRSSATSQPRPFPGFSSRRDESSHSHSDASDDGPALGGVGSWTAGREDIRDGEYFTPLRLVLPPCSSWLG